MIFIMNTDVSEQSIHCTRLFYNTDQIILELTSKCAMYAYTINYYITLIHVCNPGYLWIQPLIKPSENNMVKSMCMSYRFVLRKVAFKFIEKDINCNCI